MRARVFYILSCNVKLCQLRPFSPGGLYVSLSNWQGFGEDFLKLGLERGAGFLFVHEAWKRVPKMATEETAGEGGASDMVYSRHLDLLAYTCFASNRVVYVGNANSTGYVFGAYTADRFWTCQVEQFVLCSEWPMNLITVDFDLP